MMGFGATLAGWLGALLIGAMMATCSNFPGLAQPWFRGARAEGEGDVTVGDRGRRRLQRCAQVSRYEAEWKGRWLGDIDVVSICVTRCLVVVFTGGRRQRGVRTLESARRGCEARQTEPKTKRGEDCLQVCLYVRQARMERKSLTRCWTSGSSGRSPKPGVC